MTGVSGAQAPVTVADVRDEVGPDWQLREGRFCWTATRRPTPTAVEVIVGRDLSQLVVKLRAERPWRTWPRSPAFSSPRPPTPRRMPPEPSCGVSWCCTASTSPPWWLTAEEPPARDGGELEAVRLARSRISGLQGPGSGRPAITALAWLCRQRGSGMRGLSTVCCSVSDGALWLAWVCSVRRVGGGALWVCAGAGNVRCSWHGGCMSWLGGGPGRGWRGEDYPGVPVRP